MVIWWLNSAVAIIVCQLFTGHRIDCTSKENGRRTCWSRCLLMADKWWWPWLHKSVLATTTTTQMKRKHRTPCVPSKNKHQVSIIWPDMRLLPSQKMASHIQATHLNQLNIVEPQRKKWTVIPLSWFCCTDRCKTFFLRRLVQFLFYFAPIAAKRFCANACKKN